MEPVFAVTAHIRALGVSAPQGLHAVCRQPPADPPGPGFQGIRERAIGQMSGPRQSSRLAAEREIVYSPSMRGHHLRFTALLGTLALICVGACLLSGCSSAGTGAESDRILVVIDAGHGGRDPGAICDGVHEADVNLAIAERIATLIEVDERLDVRRTRTLDISVTLEERIAVANDADATLYLSVQSNACEYPDATGVVTLVSDTLSEGAPTWQFAEILQDAVSDATGARDRGVRAQDLYLHRATMPAALIEVGFLTNDEERTKLVDADYQQTIAQGIYDGIVAYLAYAHPSFADR